MSKATERFQAAIDEDEVLETIERWYHVPVLGVLVAFMFYVRALPFSEFYQSGLLAANDSWYHWRSTLYTVENWPRTMPYDVWTGYPTGRYVGQFGTLFDQIVATIALIVGLGNPSEETILAVALLAVPAMAALVAIPTYFIGRRLGGRPAGLAAVGLLALFPGTFMARTTSGMFQHHVAEVLFMTIAVLATMVALRSADIEKPVFELVIDRDYHGLRRPVGYAALAGVAIGLYVWSWPPGVVIIGIFGVFYAIKLAADYVLSVSPDHVAFVGAVSMGVAGIMTLSAMETTGTSATSFSLIQPMLAFGVAIGCVFMAWLAREWDERDLAAYQYPVAVGLLIVGGFAFVAIALPDVFSTIVDNVQRRMLFGQGVTDLTIEEAQPPADPRTHVQREYGFAFYTAMIGLLALAARPLYADEHRSDYFLIVVWAVFITAMAFTQVRFNYYYAVTIAVLNAYLVGIAFQWADLSFDRLRSTDSSGYRKLGEIEGYQVLVVATVLLLLFAPLLPPIAGFTVVAVGEHTTAAHSADNAIKWDESNAWLANSTPEQGKWGGANGELEYYGTYAIPEDGNFDYPEGTYGVMSWWDYGHLITVHGERIPHSNPFQQNARSSAAYLTADSEERAELVLDGIAAGERVNDRSTAELEEAVGDGEFDEEIRYVMIDDSMAGGKFQAISQWSGPDYDHYESSQEFSVGENDTAMLSTRNENFDNTTLSRLYFDDAEEMSHYRLVHEGGQSQFVSVAISQQGGPWQNIVVDQVLTPQLQQYLFQLQMHPEIEVDVYEDRQAASVKTFERVDGASIVGEADVEPGTEVTAAVQLHAEPTNRTFIYSQTATVEDDGTFELVVPYATTDELGPEDGYTDAAVHATGEYSVTVGDELGGTVDVPESAIYDGDEVTVELEPIETGEDDADEENGTDSDDDTSED